MSEDEDYEKRVKFRTKILLKEFKDGKMKFASKVLETGFLESLSKIQFDALGDPIVATVDGRIRSAALISEHFFNRQVGKNSISLREIQFEYFDFIEENFGYFYKIMISKKSNPHNAAVVFSNNDEVVKQTYHQIEPFIFAIKEFWANIGDINEAHIQDSSSIKAAFGGDLFPSYTKNIGCSLGLYLDTIILPDPFLRTEFMFKGLSPKKAIYYFFKHGLQLMNYKLLALANFDDPIIAILPDSTLLSKNRPQILSSISEPDIIRHAGSLFEIKFSEMGEVSEFLHKYKDPEVLVNKIKVKKKLLFDIDWLDPLPTQIYNYWNLQLKNFFPEFHAGDVVFHQIIGRMHQANDVILKARELNSEPLLDAPTSWQYLKWKYEYNITEQADFSKIHIIKGIQSLSEQKLKWLSKVTPKELIMLRKRNVHKELREIFSKGLTDIKNLSDDDFLNSSNEILKNIQNTFIDHEKKLSALSKNKIKFLGDLSSRLAVGSAELLAIAKGNPALGVLAYAIDQTLEIPKVKDLWKQHEKQKNELASTLTSPVGLFVDLKNKYE